VNAPLPESEQSLPPDDPLQASLASTRRALARGRWEEAMQSATPALATLPGLRRLEKMFAARDGLDRLIARIWETRTTSLAQLSAVATFMRMCRRLKDEVHLGRLREWVLDPTTEPLAFSYRDYLNNCRADDADMPDLFRFKYTGWDASSPDAFWRSVGALTARCRTPESVLRAAFEKTSGGLSFEAWTDALKVPQCLGHVFRDANIAAKVRRKIADDHPSRAFVHVFREDLSDDALAALVHNEPWIKFGAGLDAAGGLLLCTLHSHGLRVARRMLSTLVPDAHVVSVVEIKGGDRQEPARDTAVFRAVNALRASKPVLIASDASNFAEAVGIGITVHGVPLRISMGTALIAYRAQCRTAFFYSVCKDREFIPVFVPGPARVTGERFEDFRNRWVAFYAAEYERALSASPSDLVSLMGILGTGQTVPQEQA
jgi:hypothetical protein